MNRTEHLLTILGEECVETAHRVSKAVRFTLGDIQPSQELSNAQRIIYEFNDIVAVMEILVEESLLERSIDRIAIELKKKKVKEFVLYAESIGALHGEDLIHLYKQAMRMNEITETKNQKMFNALQHLLKNAEDRDEVNHPDTGEPCDEWKQAIDAINFYEENQPNDDEVPV